MGDQNAKSASAPGVWTDDDWEPLLLSIRAKKCTPFLGAGACWGVLPLGRDIAKKWADSDGYPFQDTENLVRVAQYVASLKGGQVPKLRIQEAFKDKYPNFEDDDEPHRIVADLKLPVYLTTNYDDFMLRALKRDSLANRNPERALCRWHLARRGRFEGQDLAPTVDSPIVFHLHGNFDDVNSLVLTEDDYLEFLTVAIERGEIIPPAIEQTFGASAFLFLGYSLDDLNFKVLFRKLATYLGGNSFRHVAVQLAPAAARPGPCGRSSCPAKSAVNNAQPTEEEISRADRQRLYLEKQYGLIQVNVYWGTCRQFAKELKEQWDKFNRAVK